MLLLEKKKKLAKLRLWYTDKWGTYILNSQSVME
jgi:hypothetical protein